LILTTATVHTEGINWASVAVIIGGIGTFVLAALVFTVQLIERRNKAVRDDITNAVTNLGTILEAKLETKDAVSQLRVEMAEMRGQLASIHKEVPA
jgi:predicted trehalose synthase